MLLGFFSKLNVAVKFEQHYQANFRFLLIKLGPLKQAVLKQIWPRPQSLKFANIGYNNLKSDNDSKNYFSLPLNMMKKLDNQN